MFGRNRIKWDGAWVLITGAASGIGRQTALDVADLGANVVMCDVDEAGLDDLAPLLEARGVEVLYAVVDVSDRTSMEYFSDMVHSHLDAVDVLINNAGVAVEGSMMDMTLEQWDWLMGVNLWGVIYGCHFFVPRMMDTGRAAHVVNIASLAGLLGTGVLGAYSVTKFAVVGMSEALEDELRPHGIGVSVICPGFIQTNIANAMIMTEERESRRETLESMLKKQPGPKKVSKAIIDAVNKGTSLRPVNLSAWFIYMTKRLAPGATKRTVGVLSRFVRD